MAITIQNTTGGLFSGSGARPNGTAGNGLTGVANDIFLLASYAARAQTSGVFDYHSITSVTAAGVTFSKLLGLQYQYQEVSGSFPTASCSMDVWWAKATGTMNNVSFDSTMSGADSFINDGWFAMQTIRGLDPTTPFDTHVPNPKTDTNVSLSSTTPSLTIDVLASESLVWFLAFLHSTAGSQAGMTPPSGFTVPGTGSGSHFKSEVAQSTHMDGCMSYKTFNAPQGGLIIPNGSSDNCWAVASIAMRGANAQVANTKRAYATVVN